MIKGEIKMISCTEFIPAYSELFHYLDENFGRDEVDCFWADLFTPNGKKGFFYNHHNSERWSRYIVKSKFKAVVTQAQPTLVEIQEEAPAGYKYFISPRHMDFEGQMGMLEEINWDIRNFAQEYGCEFVDAQDQVFAQDLIDRMFGMPAESSLAGQSSFFMESAEPDPAFKEDYSAWNMQASSM